MMFWAEKHRTLTIWLTYVIQNRKSPCQILTTRRTQNNHAVWSTNHIEPKYSRVIAINDFKCTGLLIKITYVTIWLISLTVYCISLPFFGSIFLNHVWQSLNNTTRNIPSLISIIEKISTAETESKIIIKLCPKMM